MHIRTPCSFHMLQLQLNFIRNLDLFPWFERRLPNIWASITTERVPQRTIPTAANFALNGEIHF